MASINQSDVALNSGSSFVQVATSGKALPVDDTSSTVNKVGGAKFSSIEPQNRETKQVTTRDRKVTTIPIFNSVESNEERSNTDSNRDIVASAVTKLNDFAQHIERDLEFSVINEAGISVVNVINRHSRELIRQIPGDEAVDLARKLNDQDALRLFSVQV